MRACDIRQYLIRQNVFCTNSPNITLANILFYTVVVIKIYFTGCPLVAIINDNQATCFTI